MAITSFVFDEQYYLTENPDVAAAVSSGLFTSGQDHFQQFGRFEGRDPNALFDTSFYLGLYPDVAAAGVNPFQHFLDFGAEEGRFFNANIEQIDTDNDTLADEFDSATYLAANPDVAAAVTAGIFANAYQHYVLFGQFEIRSGVQTTSGDSLTGPFVIGGDGVGDQGTTFTLTQGTDAGPAFTGGEFDDVFNAPAEQTAFLPIQTLTDGDDLDGGGGRDTLNAGLTNLFTVPTGLTSIEEINFSAPASLFGAGLFTPTLDLVNADSVDTLGFRGLANGATINNLSTDLTDINLQDIVPNPLVLGSGAITVNHVGAELDDADDSINLNAQNVGEPLVGGPIRVVLNTSSAAASAGYETININSNGSVPNTFQVAGSATAATTLVNILGTADLTVNDTGGSAWDAATLDLIDATNFTGNLNTSVTGTGDIQFLGGNGVNDVAFGRNVNATATGGAANDIFSFQALGTGISSFDGNDSVDGAGGTDNVLAIEALNGELLGGDGSGITNVQRVRHITDNPINGNNGFLSGNLTVNMAIAGSATILELFGDYDLNDVTVNELTNDDTVIYDADDTFGANEITNLTLNHTFAGGILESLQLDIQGGSDILGDLIIPFDPGNPVNGVEALLLNVGAGDSQIAGANQINTDIQITGDGNLALGSDFDGNFAAGNYDFENGVIDASAFIGDLTVRLGADNQAVTGGLGDDLIVVVNDSSGAVAFDSDDLINLSAGGADVVRFLAETEEDGGSLTGADYHHVTGFSVTGDAAERDIIQVDALAFSLDNTDSGTAVNPGDAVSIFDYVNGSSPNLDSGGGATEFNFIKFTTGVNTAGIGAEEAFTLAMAGGEINVQDANDEFLMALYDTTNSQMLLFTVEENTGPFAIDGTDDIAVVATVGMSFADYQAFDGNNLQFV